MQIDPLVVAVGAAICIVPVLFGILIAYWPRPTLRDDTRVYGGQLYRRDAADAMIRGGPAMVPEEAWQQEGMQDEGDLHTYRHCNCAMCRDRRTERDRFRA